MLQPSRVRKPLGLLVGALFLSVLAGCGGDDDPTGVNNQRPVARITASPLQVPFGDNNQTVVTFDGTASTDPDGDTLTHSWSVPNGTFVQNTTASDPIIRVTFPGAAPYTITLTVSDGKGGGDMASVTIGLI